MAAKDSGNGGDADRDRPIDRRRFFREGLRELLRPFARVVEPLERVVHEIGALDKTEPPATPKPAREPPRTHNLIPTDVWLRPPGAIAESAFRTTCSRCGECVKVCPAQCIKIDMTMKNGVGVPYINADEMPCVLCDGLLCMQGCPTGALVPTPLASINMGTAVWREDNCLRPKGEDCQVCVTECPIGSFAIELKHETPTGEIVINPRGCTGCGICQNKCPTSPKAVVVIPKAAREQV